MRNTAPCILYAALKIHHKDSLANMLVLPSDHFIDHLSAYQADLRLALNRAAQKMNYSPLVFRPPLHILVMATSRLKINQHR